MNDESSSYIRIRERLEEIVVQIRSKDVPLEKSLDLYEEALRLGSMAAEMIDNADFGDDEMAAADAISDELLQAMAEALDSEADPGNEQPTDDSSAVDSEEMLAATAAEAALETLYEEPLDEAELEALYSEPLQPDQDQDPDPEDPDLEDQLQTQGQNQDTNQSSSASDEEEA